MRNATTKQFKAIRSLQARLRWALTGTPIQNTLDDLASLISILKVPLPEEPTQFKRHITGPIGDIIGRSGSRYTNLQKLLGSICLRRTKEILPILQSTEDTRFVDFSIQERQDYDRIAQICRNALDLAVSGHETGRAHQTTLDMLLRLRLYCNHGRSYRNSEKALAGGCEESEEILSLLEQSGVASCAYCDCDIASIITLGNKDGALLTSCHRLVCSDCIAQWKSDCRKHARCLICQSTHTTDPVTETERSQPTVEVYPSKVVALCRDVQMHKREGKWWVRSCQS